MGEYRRLHDPNFDYDAATGTRQQIIIEEDGTVRFINTQDTTDLLRFTHEARGEFVKSQRLGDFAPVGSIPVVVLYDLIKRGIWRDPERRRRWWNSVEAAPYRLREFRV